jgi:hypothetical protein
MSFTKLLILLIFLGILVSLASGLVFLFKDRDDQKRTVKALTWRIGLSVGLFLLLLLLNALGIIEPGKI